MGSRMRSKLARLASVMAMIVPLIGLHALAAQSQENGTPTGSAMVQSTKTVGASPLATTGVRTPSSSPAPVAALHSDFPLNPDAKWVCDQQTVTAEPVWRGQERLSFTFKIRNEGTADLRIRAKGG